VGLPVGGMEVCFECCVFPGKGLCVGLIIRSEESYGVGCVWVWSWSLDSEVALARVGQQRHRKRIQMAGHFNFMTGSRISVYSNMSRRIYD